MYLAGEKKNKGKELDLVEERRTQANCKKTTWRILEKSEYNETDVHKDNVQNTKNVHETSKSDNANKAENAVFIFCKKPL